MQYNKVRMGEGKSQMELEEVGKEMKLSLWETRRLFNYLTAYTRLF